MAWGCETLTGELAAINLLCLDEHDNVAAAPRHHARNLSGP
jgi:hypothetical protein